MIKSNANIQVDMPAQRRHPFYFDDKSFTIETDTIKD
jgi:hypothetical protein